MKVHPSLVDASPLKADRVAGVDILVIRELTGGLYFGQPKGRETKDGVERAVDTLEYHDFEVRRVMELAFRMAQARRRKVTSVDKANVLESSRLWRADRHRGRPGAPGRGARAHAGRHRRDAARHQPGDASTWS